MNKSATSETLDPIGVERFNCRCVIIARLFSYNRFLGIEERASGMGISYFGINFDRWYDIEMGDLMDYEIWVEGLVYQYGELMGMYGDCSGKGGRDE